MGGLADTLRTEATKAVVAEMRGILQKNVTEKQTALSRAKEALDKALDDLDGAKEAVDIFNKTFDDILAAAPVRPQPVIDYFWIASQSESRKKGHFLTRDRATLTTTCTCEAGQYGRKCWAQDRVGANVSGFRSLTKAQYDARNPAFNTTSTSYRY